MIIVNRMCVFRSAKVRLAAGLGLLAFGLGSGVAAIANSQTSGSADAVLEAAGARVQQFFARAETLICLETVVMQPLSVGLTPDGFSRTVETELRLSWEPEDGDAATEAEVERHVLRVNGRPPRGNDRRSCTTPEQESTETQPLSMLLPSQRARFAFERAGTAELDGRPTTTVDFRELGDITTDVRAVEGIEDCVSWDFTGGRQGRLWIDRDTADVLRLDQHLSNMIELPLPEVLARRPGSGRTSLTLERSDVSIRFRRVAFSDPDETIVLPHEAIELRVMRGGERRLRTVTTYSDYRRFLTGGRLTGTAPF